jgi:hypothetical protein
MRFVRLVCVIFLCGEGLHIHWNSSVHLLNNDMVVALQVLMAAAWNPLLVADMGVS